MTKTFGKAWLITIYIFFYVPIITLVVFSFNNSPLVTVWSGITLKWYTKLSTDQEVLSGLKLSLKLAFLSASLSVLFGTFTAFALARYSRFKGRTLLASMANVPLVMPDVLIGLSILLLLVTIQQKFGAPERGLFTILLGHAFLGTAYSAVVMLSRLKEMDSKLEEAAMDLGCKPFQVFKLVTLPLIVPALVSSFLLTFTLSFDDVVLSAFLSGPGSTTLPLVIFSRARLGLNPTINAVASVIIAIVSIAVILSSLYQSRAERRRLEDISLAYNDANQ